MDGETDDYSMRMCVCTSPAPPAHRKDDLRMGTRPLIAALLLFTAGAAPAEVPRGPVVLELFTSEGCSSCPPADALLTELATHPELLPLAFHVTYWDGLGWKDPFSLAAATERQRAYAAHLGADTVYTPELVVNGQRAVVGSDRGAVMTAIDAASHEAPAPASLRLRGGQAGLAVDVGGGGGTASIWVAGYDRQHRTAIGRGENGGRTLLEANIVRSMRQIGTWTGQPLHLDVEPIAGEEAAALLQAPDGRILSAARLERTGS
jgi:hypothetical protein